MSTIIIPTRTDGSQRYNFRTAIGTSIFELEFTWNTRDNSWSISISDTAGNLLLCKKININVPLTYRYSNPNLPKGEFIAVDTSGQDQETSLQDLGSRVLFLFTDAADLP